MAIQFHCVRCGEQVEVGNQQGGQRGACPKCGADNYVPAALSDQELFDLEPLDESEERSRRLAAREDAALQQRLLREKPSPHDRGPSAPVTASTSTRVAPAPPPPPSPLSDKEINSLIVRYIEAMSNGRLDEANQIVGRLSASSEKVLNVLESLGPEELASYGVGPLPRPVLIGFIKQLRQHL